MCETIDLRLFAATSVFEFVVLCMQMYGILYVTSCASCGSHVD